MLFMLESKKTSMEIGSQARRRGGGCNSTWGRPYSLANIIVLVKQFSLSNTVWGTLLLVNTLWEDMFKGVQY